MIAKFNNMQTVVITGFIGAGKSYVSDIFNKYLGIPTYNSDLDVEKILNNNYELKEKIIHLLGINSFMGSDVNKAYIASKVFNDQDLLKEYEQLLIPYVIKELNKWLYFQQHQMIKDYRFNYIIIETAIAFKNNFYKNFNSIIEVTAEKVNRYQRAISRTNYRGTQDFNLKNDIQERQRSIVTEINIPLYEIRNGMHESILFYDILKTHINLCESKI